MIFQESKQVRTIVGRLEEGEECIEQLTEFCREHDIEAAEVRGIGRLDHVDVVRFDPQADQEDGGQWVPVFEGEGNFDVLNLSGNVSMLGDEVVVRLEAVLAAEGPVGPQVVTGKLRSGRAVEFEFVLEAFRDLRMERRLDPKTGLLTLSEIQKTRETPQLQAASEPRQPAEPAQPAHPDQAVGGSAPAGQQAGSQSGGQSGSQSGSQAAPPEAKAKRGSGSAGSTGPSGPSSQSSQSSRTDQTSQAGDSQQDDEITGKAMTWGDVARESGDEGGSQRAGGDGESGSLGDESSVKDIYGDLGLDDPVLEAGDILEHPKLGRCRVMKVEDDRYAHIRLPRGKIRKLSLDVVGVEFKGEENGRHVFRAQVGR